MPNVTIAKGLNLFYRKSGSGDRHLLLIHGNTASSLWWERVMGTCPGGPAWPPTSAAAATATSRAAAGPSPTWGTTSTSSCRPSASGGHRGRPLAGRRGGQQLAVDHPELVERLVLVNSAEPAGLVTPPERYAQLEAAIRQPELLKMALAAMMPTAPKDEFYHRLLEESVTKSAGALIPNGRALDNMNLVEQVKGIRVPVLILYGQQDALITLEMMQRANHRFRAPPWRCGRRSATPPRWRIPSGLPAGWRRSWACETHGSRRNAGAPVRGPGPLLVFSAKSLTRGLRRIDEVLNLGSFRRVRTFG